MEALRVIYNKKLLELDVGLVKMHMKGNESMINGGHILLILVYLFSGNGVPYTHIHVYMCKILFQSLFSNNNSLQIHLFNQLSSNQ